MSNYKDPVKLRRRKQKGAVNTSLYLDIYVDGRRTYEYLKLYLVPEKTRADKEKNKETLRFAEAVRAKRLVDVQNGRYGFEEARKLNTDFLEYFAAMCEKRRENGTRTWLTWTSCLQHLRKYCKPGTTFKAVTKEWVQGFKDYLDKAIRERKYEGKEKPLSQNTKMLYFEKFRVCLRKAYDEGIMSRNPLCGVTGFRKEETERAYLTIEEVRRMAREECCKPVLKRAFLFSCLTGLRKSDIERLKWGDVSEQGEYTRITFTQKKTGGLEYLDISPEAVRYLGERGKDEELVFKGFHYSARLLLELRLWATGCGITKPITFHSGRHTFAVLMLDLGADIYTVQKLLGHKDIHTTMIYADILDKKKQAAVSMIPSVLPPAGLE